jgi:hypothetical protein
VLGVLAVVVVMFVGTARGEQCPGCVGGSSSASNSIPGCGTVSITVTIASGICTKVTHPPDPTIYCEQTTQGCHVVIQRQWTGIPAGADVNGCVIQGGQRYCIDPPLATDGGSNTDTREYDLNCGSGEFTWTIKSECGSAQGGQMTALCSGQCTGCIN